MRKYEAPLYQALRSYRDQNVYPFHTPGHKQGRGLWIPDLISLDLTEVEGTDNLYQPVGPIAKAQELAAHLFGAEATYFLVNGSTVGILTSIATVCQPGDTLLVARNVHRSVYSGMILIGVQPKYIVPEILPEYGLIGGVSPQKVYKGLCQYPEAKGVLLVSPTYEGFTSDISTIAKMVHEQNKILIVDEAHGAHFVFHDHFPITALEAGADIVIQSTHKTLPAFTQSAMLHVQGSRVLKDKVRERLSLFQSSSPSYLLMAGLDYCRYQLERQANLDFDQFIEQLYELRKNLSPLSTLELMDQKIEGQGSIDEIDISKILLSCRYCRESGADIESILRKEYQIQMELSAPHHLLGITTVADSKKGFQRLTQALCSIDGKLKKVYKKADINFIWDNIPSIQYTPREASFMSTDFFPLKESIGQAIGEFVIPYPPGIPLLVPGEVITQELVERIQFLQQQGVRMIGMQDMTGQMVQVLQDRRGVK
ncbi:MAG: aminotransferase class I/II-fold pyridoxal phosphate-dependent enzyme [Epulopiscium sp.]|nr:aminotransferase class I/II-fold pyridoxal phosphate-dependent enzyme [Candidatus Epulonipiscium sp.]